MPDLASPRGKKVPPHYFAGSQLLYPWFSTAQDERGWFKEIEISQIVIPLIQKGLLDLSCTE